MSARSLVYDLKVFSAAARLQQNILSVRTAITTNPAFLKEQGFSLSPAESVTLENMDYNVSFCLHSSSPVEVEATVDTNTNPTVFEGQTLLIISSKVSDVTITNTSDTKATVSVVQLGSWVQPIPPTPDVIPSQLITFDTLQRITALPQAITTLSKVRVEDVTLNPFSNDQTTSPGVGVNVLNKYRICNSDGTANATGAFIMLLDDNITQQNMSGTLQVWVRELA